MTNIAVTVKLQQQDLEAKIIRELQHPAATGLALGFRRNLTAPTDACTAHSTSAARLNI